MNRIPFLSNHRRKQQAKQGTNVIPTYDEIDELFDPLRRALVDYKDKKNADLPRQIAEVQIVLDQPLRGMDELEKIIVVLDDLEKIFRENVTLSDVFTDTFKGNWKIIFSRDNTFDDLNLTLFPTLQVENLAVGIYEDDMFELVKFFGTFKVDLMERKLQFDFDEIAVLGLRADLPTKRLVGSKTVASGGTGDAEEQNGSLEHAEKPFFDKISTNETSAPMAEILDIFDEWYFKILEG